MSPSMEHGRYCCGELGTAVVLELLARLGRSRWVRQRLWEIVSATTRIARTTFNGFFERLADRADSLVRPATKSVGALRAAALGCAASAQFFFPVSAGLVTAVLAVNALVDGPGSAGDPWDGPVQWAARACAGWFLQRFDVADSVRRELLDDGDGGGGGGGGGGSGGGGSASGIGSGSGRARDDVAESQRLGQAAFYGAIGGGCVGGGYGGAIGGGVSAAAAWALASGAVTATGPAAVLGGLGGMLWGAYKGGLAGSVEGVKQARHMQLAPY